MHHTIKFPIREWHPVLPMQRVDGMNMHKNKKKLADG